ncbi:hypothetical protein [Nitrosomonas aestuarii]|uniref:hypothetical protein n=1 Tax=Nitrosomonas aestuarii TaxID=52441 RepID=UPI000D3198B9|nr:hypothetical protein [Nitrosomonas aestuarii]PTN13094.1 hypothetical protein C8R11_10177 [Nitrosomonas aestuarii]
MFKLVFGAAAAAQIVFNSPLANASGTLEIVLKQDSVGRVSFAALESIKPALHQLSNGVGNVQKIFPQMFRA